MLIATIIFLMQRIPQCAYGPEPFPSFSVPVVVVGLAFVGQTLFDAPGRARYGQARAGL
jgi:hypothetical protein